MTVWIHNGRIKAWPTGARMTIRRKIRKTRKLRAFGWGGNFVRRDSGPRLTAYPRPPPPCLRQAPEPTHCIPVVPLNFGTGGCTIQRPFEPHLRHMARLAAMARSPRPAATCAARSVEGQRRRPGQPQASSRPRSNKLAQEALSVVPGRS